MEVVPANQYQGLIVDFYGVLTDGIDAAMNAWTELDDIEYSRFQEAMSEWFADSGYVQARFNPIHALERGEMEIPDFEDKLAARLKRRDGSAVSSEGLVERMFSHFRHAQDMAGLVRRAHEGGLRTALLSNSWGDQYIRNGWDDMFDAVVISGEVGMRKPEPQIFEYTLTQLGLHGSQCVFVDDHQRNVDTAVSLGIVGILHVNYEQTANELEALFRMELAI